MLPMRSWQTLLENPSGSPDEENGPRARAESREEIEQLLPRRIFLVQQLHAAIGFRAGHNLGVRIHPLVQQAAARVAWRNSHAVVVPDALHFSRNADGIDVQLCFARIEAHGGIRGKPHGRLHAFAAFFEGFEIQVLVPGKRRKSHGLAPADSLRAILPRAQTKWGVTAWKEV